MTTEVMPAKDGYPEIKFKKGTLHTATGTPQNEKIPAKKFASALSGMYGEAAKKKAQFAKNVLRHK